MISSKDIQQIDNMLKMLNEMVEGVKVKREGKKVIIEYDFISEDLAKMYYGALQSVFSKE